MRDEHFLRVVIALATAGCAADPPPPPATVTPETRKPVATHDEDKPTIVQGDPTEGVGKCRCSWDKNANAAPRVCKKNEVSYNGGMCKAGARPKYPIAIGPLPPPDLGS
jgi:hypothetical protein